VFDCAHDIGFTRNLPNDFDIRLLGNSGNHKLADQSWAICDQNSDGIHRVPPHGSEYPEVVYEKIGSNAVQLGPANPEKKYGND
ncbi:MAG: hypothetical protein ACREDR_16480, partial [Blastocatellia bacterium]